MYIYMYMLYVTVCKDSGAPASTRAYTRRTHSPQLVCSMADWARHRASTAAPCYRAAKLHTAYSLVIYITNIDTHDHDTKLPRDHPSATRHDQPRPSLTFLIITITNGVQTRCAIERSFSTMAAKMVRGRGRPHKLFWRLLLLGGRDGGGGRRSAVGGVECLLAPTLLHTAKIQNHYSY